MTFIITTENFSYCELIKKLLTQKIQNFLLNSQQLQFVRRRNISIHKKLKKHEHMIFTMTSLNDDKSDISQFFYQDLFHIVNTVYVQNFM